MHLRPRIIDLFIENNIKLPMNNTVAHSIAQGVLRVNRVMRNVYRWMTVGLTLTGVVAFAISSNAAIIRAITGNPIIFIVIIVAQIGLVIYLSTRIYTMTIQAATLAFGAYAVLTGVMLAPIFVIYTGTSIASTLFICAGSFATMSIWAMVTKRDLSSWGQYLFFGLIGIVVASIVNIFLRSDGLYWIISLIGVVLFLGLTAYDTQRIASMCAEMGDNPREIDYIRVSIIGALKLYLDFVNLFIFLLRLLGRRR